LSASLAAGITAAGEVLASGAALAKLDALVTASQLTG
jgi:anthranilate phosphoribosyltransferase